MKRRRYVYLLETFEGKPRYATVTNKRTARMMLKRAGGGTIYAMLSTSYHEPRLLYGWDVPTFKTCCHEIDTVGSPA